MAAPKRTGLGKGLGALITESSANVELTDENIQRVDSPEQAIENAVVFVDINKIKPNANQPRKHFNEEKIEELADSIKNHGIIQPVVLRKSENGYEIVAGERRWRAARKAELKEIPCIIKVLTDEQNMLLAIIENMQREDLNPIEEAEAVNQMISSFGLTQEEVSKSIGKSRPYITNSLRLLKLAGPVKDYVIEGKLTSGHARALLSITDEKKQQSLAEKIIGEGMSVREVEKLTGEEKPGKKAVARPKKKNADVARVEEELKEILGTKVNIRHTGKKGKIEIECYSREELDRIIELLKSIQ